MLVTLKFIPIQDQPTINQDKSIWLEQEIANSGKLDALILEYEYGNGKLQHVHIIPETLKFNSDTEGRFNAGYELNEYSLCAAIDYTATNDMVIDFKINKFNNEIILTGEDRLERLDEI